MSLGVYTCSPINMGKISEKVVCFLHTKPTVYNFQKIAPAPFWTELYTEIEMYKTKMFFIFQSALEATLS